MSVASKPVDISWYCCNYCMHDKYQKSAEFKVQSSWPKATVETAGENRGLPFYRVESSAFHASTHEEYDWQ